MDVQDYEYYEARAKDVKMEDITSDEDNADILERLRDNDPVTLLISTEIGEDFKRLGPFLRKNTSLSHLTFGSFNIGLQCARSIASLLDQQSSLKCLSVEEADLGDEELVEIATVLITQPQIEELNLCHNNIGRNGCVALGNVLEDLRNPNLAALDLGSNDIDDEGLHALVEGLRKCRKLTSLCLSGNRLITVTGLRSLSTLLQSEHCRLEHLALYDTNMDNDGAAVLAAGLVSLPTLKKLNISNNRISDLGLQALVGSLVNCNIEDLYLSHNSFSVFGLRSLGTLEQRATSLKSLCLRNNAIDDEGLQCLVEGMVNCYSLTELGLSYNPSITAAGLRKLSTFFQSDNCCLEKLWLWGINFGDEGVITLADGLMGNKSLTDLRFDSQGITARGWAAFSKLLCDTASVNNTYLSNHTLERIGGFFHPNTPSDIVEYLKLNNLQNRATATCKILVCHPDIDVEPLFQWKLKCLPLVVRWLENARSHLGNVNESTLVFQCRQLSALYKFVRGMPQLSVDGYRGKKTKNIQPKSKKRKLDQTL